VSKLSDEIDESARRWLDPIKDTPLEIRYQLPNFAIGTALQEVARAIRSVEATHPKQSKQVANTGDRG